jgi:hypothetical protein
MAISWQAPDRIERVIVSSVRDADGNPLDTDGALRKRILELEEQLGLVSPPSQSCSHLIRAHCPHELKGEIRYAVAQAIKRNVPKADQRPPEEVISEVMEEFEKLLQAKYATVATAKTGYLRSEVDPVVDVSGGPE